MERTDLEQWKSKEVARLLALVETERRYYQEMVASLPVPLVVLSSERNVISANRAFRQTFHLRFEDLRRKTLDQILPSERLTEKIRDVHVHGITQQPFILEIEGRSLRIAIVPIRNWDDDMEVETLLMAEDLTGIDVSGPSGAGEPSVVEEPAAAVEPSFTHAPLAGPSPAPPVAFALQGVPAVLWHANTPAAPFTATGLTFTSVAGAVEQILGYPAPHWLETPRFFAERIHPDDRASALALYQAALGQGGDASAEYRAISASGDAVWCRETIRVSAADENGRTVTGVLTEIGQRKEIEDRLLTAARHTALRGLSGRLAHDLNNPLMIVTGYGEEMLLNLPPQDGRREDVAQILAATERISGLTHQLLEFTRPQAAAPQPMEVTRAIARMEESIAHSAGEGVTVELMLAGPVWAHAEETQLEEILLSLVSGAREDARERSRVTVGCDTTRINEHIADSTLDPGLYTRLTIHDNGKGSDAEQRAAVFESVLARDPGKHIGSALARAYSVVRAWGGDIAFWSEPFRGSTFTVYLPHFQPEPPPPPPEPVAAAALPAELPTHQEAVDRPPAEVVPEPAPEPVPEPLRETILVVDDEDGIRALVGKILRRERYQVLEAGSAEEALRVISAHGALVNLLLTDAVLPAMHGRELAARLRESMPDLKVLYISGYTADEGVRTGEFPPGSKFLQKPFTLSALVRTVREAIES